MQSYSRLQCLFKYTYVQHMSNRCSDEMNVKTYKDTVLLGIKELKSHHIDTHYIENRMQLQAFVVNSQFIHLWQIYNSLVTIISIICIDDFFFKISSMTLSSRNGFFCTIQVPNPGPGHLSLFPAFPCLFSTPANKQPLLI